MRIREPLKTVITVGVTVAAVLFVRNTIDDYVLISKYQDICAYHQDPEWCLAQLTGHRLGRDLRMPGEWRPVDPDDK